MYQNPTIRIAFKPENDRRPFPDTHPELIYRGVTLTHDRGGPNETTINLDVRQLEQLRETAELFLRTLGKDGSSLSSLTTCGNLENNAAVAT